MPGLGISAANRALWCSSFFSGKKIILIKRNNLNLYFLDLIDFLFYLIYSEGMSGREGGREVEMKESSPITVSYFSN
jgi:hypothetical protein